MKIKSIITIIALLSVGVSALAQEKEGRTQPVRIGVALTAGANGYMSVTAQSGMLTTYQARELSADWTDKSLAFGIEGSLIICDSWKLDLGGSLSASNVPPRAEVPGTMGNAYEMGEIPTYASVDMQHRLNYSAFIASSYYFRIASAPALRPYVGVRFQAFYAGATRREQSYEAMGRSTTEGYALAPGLLTGVDYYFSRNFFVGASVEPFRYTYAVAADRPQEGLSLQYSDTHYFGVLAAPQFKIGFVF